MGIVRAPTKYRRLPGETDLGDDIELTQQKSLPPGSEWDDSSSTTTQQKSLDRKSTFGSSTYSHYALLDEADAKAPLQGRGPRRVFAGWRAGALASFVLATLVCIFNTTVTLWVWRNPQYKIEDSVGTLFQGACDTARKSNVVIHLVVNALSTLLLVASNYCMQVLSSPNREELVQAHGRRYWLHIGVPSLRNIRRIGRDRSLIWALLFLSSVPLHLLYNSVVFVNLQANNYAVIPTMENWLRGEAYDNSRFWYGNKTATRDNVTADFEDYRIDWITASNSSVYLNLSTANCFNKYSNQYISDVGNVYLVQDEPTVWRDSSWIRRFDHGRKGNWTWVQSHEGEKEESLYDYNRPDAAFPFASRATTYPSNGWRCPSHHFRHCDVDNVNEVPRDRSKWAPYESPIRYCLAERVGELCRLQFNFPFAIAVIVSNFIKAVCMGSMLLLYSKHAALATLGDAIAHFLDQPDPETRGRSLHSRRLMEAEWTWEHSHGAQKDGLGIEPERFVPEAERWGRAPSAGRWWTIYFLYTAALITGIVCIAHSMTDMPKNPVALFKMGFGTVNGNNLLSMGTSIMGGVLLANLPQALLSYLYLAFNALYTNMFVAREWSTFIEERKPLRVTSPRGQQRSTYWLNVPFRYAIPMTIASGLFHWLASQSIFMVQITVTEIPIRKVARRIDPAQQISTCGYSPSAIILTTVMGTIIALGGVIMGRYRTYAAGMPMAGSCSAAISAACHPPREDKDASLKPIQWGAVVHGTVQSDGSETVGHCTFSSLPVEYPITGRLYA